MLIRTWRGDVPTRLAERFIEHLRRTGLADYRRQPGHLGSWLLRRPVEGGRTEFVLLSAWTSAEAVGHYTRGDLDAAVGYPGDAAFDLVGDMVAQHFELVDRDGAFGDSAS
jgi:heme-degrading monooxygenase HmoA